MAALFPTFSYGLNLWVKKKSECLLFHGSLFITLACIVVFLETTGRREMPPWPAIALHGVDPFVGQSGWGRIQSFDSNAVKNNSWGQRDTERSLKKPAGKTRITFVGDSFLEESSLVPLNLLVQNKLGTDYEVVNLGVSATHTHEYFWRVKNVALKIDSDHVVTFLYAGNDLHSFNRLIDLTDFSIYRNWRVSFGQLVKQERQRLWNYGPIESFGGKFFPGINYLISRHDYPAVMTWIDQSLHLHDQGMHEWLKEGGSSRLSGKLAWLTTQILKGSKHEGSFKEFQKILKQKDLTSFYENLQNPDRGLFRSSILFEALRNMVLGKKSHNIEKHTSHAFEMILAMRNLCKEHGVKFSVVIIPQGFDVDNRIRETYLVLTDMKNAINHITLGVNSLISKLQAANIDVLDLYPVLRREGTYLNFDGHWSLLGNQITSEAVSGFILNKQTGKTIPPGF